MLKLSMATAAVVITLTMPVSAAPGGIQQFCGDRYCGSSQTVQKPQKRAYRYVKKQRYAKYRSTKKIAYTASRRVARSYRGEAQIVEHPAGCPRRSFCGCGVSLHIFGKSVRELWLAANWLRFPPASPGPGMVAARRGHVMAILKSYGDGTALVYDPNSGRHLTRIWRRSLAGYRVVNPGPSSVASRA